MNVTKSLKVVADICLYGTSRVGIGWLAAHAGGMLGTGALVPNASATETVWAAVDALRAAGVNAGTVAIFAPGGERVAYCPITNVPTYGSLTWETAPVVVISGEELAKHARGPH